MAHNGSFIDNSTSRDDSEVNSFYNFNDEDPAAEFLEREKRELGDIADDGNVIAAGEPFNTRSGTNNSLSNNGIHSCLIIVR
jgi:hypothetical protein